MVISIPFPNLQKLNNDGFSNQCFFFRVLLPTLATVAIIIAATLFVKFSKRSLISRAGKFQNPFKNLNLIFALVILAFILLHILTFYIKIPPDLLFPKMPCGFDMVAMCTMFTLFNPDAKEHMLRKCPVLQSYLEVGFFKKRVQPHSGGDNTGQVGRSDFKQVRVAEQKQTKKNLDRMELSRRPPFSDERAPRNVNGWVLTVENLEDN